MKHELSHGKILLFDNWERRLRLFDPLHLGRVGLYCCGPTVYNYAHIGNLRTYLFEDLLRRTLIFNGFNVQHVVNITDVGHLLSDADDGEDKMEHQSRRSGESAWRLAERYTAAFLNDLDALNIQRPTILCRATDHIQEQIAFIEALTHKGYTYRTSDGIYFDTSLQTNYGYLARVDCAGLEAGARIAIGEKRNATDFALWKFSGRPGVRQMEWCSPWGLGFPGWHIECSAMSCKYLGHWFDIHCGARIISLSITRMRLRRTRPATEQDLPTLDARSLFEVRQWKDVEVERRILRLQSLIDKATTH